MLKINRGITMVDVIVVIAALMILFVFLWPVFTPVRVGGIRVRCQSNIRQIVLACQLYADQTGEGNFPNYDNPMHSFERLYSEYVRDHRIFICSSKPTKTDGMVSYESKSEMPGKLRHEFNPNSKGNGVAIRYGYDNQHTPEEGVAGLVSDHGELLGDKNKRNSTNHGTTGSGAAAGVGQNVGLITGTVEWLDRNDREEVFDGLDDKSIWGKDAQLGAEDTWIRVRTVKGAAKK